MNPHRRLVLFFIALLAAALSCNIPAATATPFVFPTPITSLPGVGTPGPLSTGTITPSPTATQRAWPPPYFGSPGPTQITPIPSPMPVFTGEDSINFLLIGSDRRTTSFRTDVLIVVNFQPAYDMVTLISIPRDLYVYIPGWRMQRINAAYIHGINNYPGGGEALLKDTILYNLGIRIDHIAMVDFTGFEDIIDTLGGVDVPVACSYTDWRIIDPEGDPEDEENWELYTAGPGVVHMDGELALWYARSRIKSSDFDRGRRQQEVLRAIYGQALRLNMIPRIPALYTELNDTLTTDIGIDDVLGFIPLIDDLTTARIRSYYINTTYVTGWRNPENASVLVPNIEAIQSMLADALGPPDDFEEEQLSYFVEIWNGSNHANWDVLAQSRLEYGGFESSIAQADRRNYTQSLLYDFTPGQDPAISANLLAILGLSSASLVSQPDPSSQIHYRLIIGNDYNPCFNPARITR